MKEKNLFDVIANNLPPRRVRRAADRQISLAESIADALDLQCPNFDDFSETSKFISAHKDEYYEWREMQEAGLRAFDDEDDSDVPF